MKYPNKFELFDRFQPDSNNVQVAYDEDTGKYNFLYDSGTTTLYSESDVDGLVECFYDVVHIEPELVFPFVYKVAGYKNDPYEVSKDAEGILWWTNTIDGWKSTEPNLWTMKEVKEEIKSGAWTVTSVGEQTYDISDEDRATWKDVAGSGTPKTNLSTLTINIDTAQPVEAMNALAEAAERVNIALESMQKIMGEMGLSNG